MAEFARPRPCPACGDLAPRMLTAPALGGNASPQAAERCPGNACTPAAAPVAPLPRRLAAEAVQSTPPLASRPSHSCPGHGCPGHGALRARVGDNPRPPTAHAHPASPAMTTHDPIRFVAKNMRVDLRLIAEMIAPGTRVLDIGSGDGALIEHLFRTKGCDARGIEIDMAEVTARSPTACR